MWDLIVSVPDHCLSFYVVQMNRGFEYHNPLKVLCPAVLKFLTCFR